jgi:hypothetical protein
MLIETAAAKSQGIVEDSVPDTTETLWIVALAAGLMVQLWFGMIGTSLWRDETGTWWAVADGAAAAIRRSFYWGGTSPFYFLTVCASTRLLGPSQISLRLPSLFAMAGAIYFLYKIALRLYDRASAAVVVLVFLCIASFYAIEARPYALAMLGLTASTWALLRWLDTGRFIHAAIYVVMGAWVVYAHYLLALGLVPGAIFAAVCLRRESRGLAWLGCFFASLGLLCLPLARHLQSLSATRSAHTVAAAPSVPQIVEGLMPGALAGVLILGVWVYSVWRGEAGLTGKCTAPSALLIGTWSVFAPVFLVLLPLFGDFHLFVDRYYSSALPGQALLLGGLISSIRPGFARKALLVLLVVGTILVQGKFSVRSHGGEDWRAAMAFVNHQAETGAPVLFQSGFVEASDFAALRDPKLRDVLFAPQLVYGGPAQSIRLPHASVRTSTPDMERIFRQVEHAPRFFLLQADYDRSFEMWLLGKLGPACASELAETFGEVYLTRFTCENPG